MSERKIYDIAAQRAFYADHIQALQGVLGKLPEGMRGELAQLKEKLSLQLEGLKPTDQVPALEAGNVLTALGDAVVRIQEYASGLMERLQQMSVGLAAKATEFNGLQE